MSVAVLIPTFRRNDSLERAVLSVFSQTRTPDRIVIADNSPEAGAEALVNGLRSQAPCPLVYVHADRPGVSHARNAGFAACADMDRVAQLDDDESAAPDWLSELVRVADQTGAAVTFGPVRPKADGAGPVKTAWLRRLYSRMPDHEDGLINKPWGCGNSLIDRSACALPDPPFDADANETGGEDDRLFARLAADGASFAWASRAAVIEHVEQDRGRWTSLARRAFAFGQGPSQDAAGRKAWAAVAIWMAVGAVQAFAFSLFAAPSRLVGARACAACIDKGVQGAGKVFWFDRFAPRFYGVSLAEKTG